MALLGRDLLLLMVTPLNSSRYEKKKKKKRCTFHTLVFAVSSSQKFELLCSPKLLSAQYDLFLERYGFAALSNLVDGDLGVFSGV